MVFDLKPPAPYRLDLTVWVLRRMPVNQMDQWDGQTYRRGLPIGKSVVPLEVVQIGSAQQPRLRVKMAGRTSEAARSAASAFLRRVLGLEINLAPFYELARRDSRLDALIGPYVGFRPPRLPSVFEALLNGIACQQLSLNVGIQLLNRLCSAYAPASATQHAFVRPQDVAAAHPAGVKRLGFSGAKANAILSVSRAIVSGKLDLESLGDLDNASAIDALQELRGVGRWTAEYVMLRGLGRLDVFPADDVGGQNKLQRWLGIRKRLSYDRVHKILDRWSPYQGLIYFHLLLDELTRRGVLAASSTGAVASVSDVLESNAPRGRPRLYRG